MGLNIKNPKTQSLIRELADLTGEGQTEAVTKAVEERLKRLKRKGLAEQLLAIGRETAPLLKGIPDHAELYDYLHEKYGLPK